MEILPLENNYILSDSYSFASAKLLMLALNEKGLNLKVTCRGEKLEEPPSIRYGNSSGVWENDTTKLNSIKIIRLCSNKLRFSQVLHDGGFLNVPIFEILSNDKRPNEFPVVVRETLSSSGGRGIHLVTKEDEINPLTNKGYYWTKYVPLDFELRVHILGGKISKIFKKIHIANQEEEKYPIRNNNRGYHFQIKRVENYPKLVDVVDQISETLPEKIFFMALDVGWDKINGRYFVLEGNSAPGLNELTCELYADYIYKNLKGE